MSKREKEGEEETGQEIGELLRGIRETTKGGGYEEIPRELILEQARRVGLPEEDIPKVRIEEVAGGYINITPEGEISIVIPRREPKWKVPDTLRHELSHIKSGYGYIEGKTWIDTIKGEPAALRIQGEGRLTSNDLSSLVVTLVLEEGQPRRETTSLVMEEARSLGASEHSITSSKRWLKNHWRRLRELEELV